MYQKGLVKKLQVGKYHRFASIEDLIAVSNGEMSMEEAEHRYQEQPKNEPKGTFMATKISDDGVVTFDVI